MQAPPPPRQKLFEKGVRILHQVCTWSATNLESHANPEKADWGGGGGGGGTLTLFLPSSKVSRHGVGVSSYITNHYNKQTSKQASNNKKTGFTSKRGVRSHPSHPPFGQACSMNQMIKN